MQKQKKQEPFKVKQGISFWFLKCNLFSENIEKLTLYGKLGVIRVGFFMLCEFLLNLPQK